MTDPRLPAAISAIFDLQARLRRLEGIAEGLLAQGREHAQELLRLRISLAERIELERQVASLVAQRSALFEMVGRFRVAHRLAADLPEDRAAFVADLATALRERAQ